MGNDLTVKQNTALAADWQSEPSKVALLKSMIAPDTTDQELELAMYICKRTGLDPFARQIYFVKRSSGGRKQMTSQTSIDGFRLIADRTGLYAGQDDCLFDEGMTLYQHLESKRGNPKTATVTVYKMVGGVRCPFTATASWEQYYPGDTQGFMWRKMPHLMLSKCAEALALRKAFAAELSGIYTADEMAQADKEPHKQKTITEQAQEQQAKQELIKAGVVTGNVPIDAEVTEKTGSEAPAEPGSQSGEQLEAPKPPKWQGQPVSNPGNPATKPQVEYIKKLLDGLHGQQIDEFCKRITSFPLDQMNKQTAREFIEYLVKPENQEEIKQAKAALIKEGEKQEA